MKAIEKRIVARLLSKGALLDKDLEKILATYDGTMSLPDFLVAGGHASSRAVKQAECEEAGLTFIDLRKITPDPEALKTIQADECWIHQALPFRLEDGAVSIAMLDPNNVYAQDTLRHIAGKPVVIFIAEKKDLLRALSVYCPDSEYAQPMMDSEPSSSDAIERHREYQRRMRESRSAIGKMERGSSSIDTLIASQSDSTIDIDLDAELLDLDDLDNPNNQEALGVRALLLDATERGASEVEFDQRGEEVSVRFRRYLQWENAGSIPADQFTGLLTKIEKVLSNTPSDSPIQIATIALAIQDRPVPVTCFLSRSGEATRLLLRISNASPLFSNPLVKIGIPKQEVDAINKRLDERGGLVIVASPNVRTSQHLYKSLMREFAANRRRDVISFDYLTPLSIPGVNSVACGSDRSFSTAMEASLRLQPGFLGISHLESSDHLKLTIDLAYTGTSVLLSMTAPDSATALATFKAAGIESIHILRGVVALIFVEEVPRLCHECSKPIEDRSTLPEWTALLDADFYEANGCEECRNEGYEGTIYLVEAFAPSNEHPQAGLLPRVERFRDIMAYSISGDIDPRQHHP